MKKLTAALLLILTSIVWAAPAPNTYFIISVKTDNAGSSNNNQFTIPTLSSLAYKYSIDCNSDGVFEAVGQIGDYTCTYGSAGTYTIKIVGDAGNNTLGFPAIYFANAGDKLKILDVMQWGIGKWKTMESAFRGTANMEVTATDTPDFDTVTNLRFMFGGAVLANPDTKNWNVTNVDNMTAMFQAATSAQPDVSNWDTGNVQLMNFMFAGATSAEPDMSHWNISNVTDMTGMFNIVSLQKSTYDAALKNFSSQTVQPNVSFHAGNSQYCAIAQHLNLSNPNTNNWTITDNGTSTGCFSTDDFQTTWNTGVSTSITIPTTGAGYYYRVDWNNDGDMNDSDESIIYTGDATHVFSVTGFHTIRLKGIFPRIYFNSFGFNTNALKITNINQWGTIQWQNMDSAFSGANNMLVTATDVPDLTQVSSTKNMFRNTSNANPDTSLWNTSNIISMEGMFLDATNANPDTSMWNTSNVETMNFMFSGAINANPNTSLWDTSNVTNMAGLFQGAINANPDTSLWDTSKVTRMEHMFDGASIATPDTSNWDTSLVQSMDYMFRNAYYANPDTRNWDIGNIRFINLSGLTNLYGFRGMFSGVKLNTLAYNNLLSKFSATANFSDLELDGGNSNYCNENSQSRDNLSINYNWTITDAGGIQCGADSSLDDFVIVVKTNNPGTSSSTQFTIPVNQDLLNPHNYHVSCRDNGSFNAGGVGGSYTCNYPAPGTYQIRIVDASSNGKGFSNIYFNNSGDRLKILDIKQWGKGKWQSMFSAFWGTANMIVTARDKPDLSEVTSLENIFRGARRANPDTKSWNVSNIRFMRRMFAGDYVANPDTSLWDTSMVQDMSYMFYQAYNANPDMSSWNIGQVSTMFQMFNGVTLPIPTYDAALINFGSQTHQSGVGFTAGPSKYCDGLTARANLMSDGWIISDLGQNCTPPQPISPPMQLSAPNDNTPLVRVNCSEAGNIVKVFLTDYVIYNFTLVANYTCVGAGPHDFEFTSPIQDGNFFSQMTETKNGDESLPSELPFGTNFYINTTPPPDPSLIVLLPNPARDGTVVTLNLAGIEFGALVSVVGMTCSPNPAPFTGLVDCGGTVGQNGLDGTNNTITIDRNGNLNTNTSTGLIVDNDAPPPPIINPVNEADTSITGTAEVSSQIAVSGATCSNNPVITTSGGVWSCSTSGLVAGTTITATATDEVGNESPNSLTVIVSGIDTTPPNAPLVNAIFDIDMIITGSAEALSTQNIVGASCTNAPVSANNNGNWSCNLSSSLVAGTQITVTSTDAANNTSAATTVFVSASSEVIFTSGFE